MHLPQQKYTTTNNNNNNNNNCNWLEHCMGTVCWETVGGLAFVTVIIRGYQSFRFWKREIILEPLSSLPLKT